MDPPEEELPPVQGPAEPLKFDHTYGGRCPRPDCPGHLYMSKTRPFIYVCSVCKKEF